MRKPSGVVDRCLNQSLSVSALSEWMRKLHAISLSLLFAELSVSALSEWMRKLWVGGRQRLRHQLSVSALSEWMRKLPEGSLAGALVGSFSLRSVGVDEEASCRKLEHSACGSFSLRSVGVDEEASLPTCQSRRGGLSVSALSEWMRKHATRAGFELVVDFQSPLCRSG